MECSREAPTSDLNLDNLLQVHRQSDIYVLGFQEIVPLNAGNVLVIEDNGSAAKWLSLISQSLNKSSNNDYCPLKRTNTNPTSFERKHSGSSSVFLQRISLRTASRAFLIDLPQHSYVISTATINLFELKVHFQCCAAFHFWKG